MVGAAAGSQRHTGRNCPACHASLKVDWDSAAGLVGECPAGHGTFAIRVPQNRRSDPLNDSDVRDDVRAIGPLPWYRRVWRLVVSPNKKAWGTSLGVLGSALLVVNMEYPSQHLKKLSNIAFGLAALTGGSFLIGAGSKTRPDEYEKEKNAQLRAVGKL